MDSGVESDSLPVQYTGDMHQIHFPSDERVITEEVARFRALSPEERMRAIRGVLAAGELMMRRSPKAAFLRQYTLEQEAIARRAVRTRQAKRE